MSHLADDFTAEIKTCLLENFLPGEDPGELDNTTPLITGGVLDSITTVQFVAFLEKRYGIKFQAHEMTVDRLNTIPDIAAIVAAKVAAKG